MSILCIMFWTIIQAYACRRDFALSIQNQSGQMLGSRGTFDLRNVALSVRIRVSSTTWPAFRHTLTAPKVFANPSSGKSLLLAARSISEKVHHQMDAVSHIASILTKSRQQHRIHALLQPAYIHLP